MVVYIGCSGWDYDFWQGSFYPEDTRNNRLAYYSKVAGFTELRSPYKRIPKEAKVLNWYNSSPDKFIFVPRMLKKVTYNSDYDLDTDLIRDYMKAFEPLDDKFQMLLLHFPMQFQKGGKTRPFLESMVEEIHSHFSGQILVEAPNRSWQKIDIKEMLQEYNACLVGNDRRPIPSLVRDPQVYYLRLLGDKRTVPKERFGEEPMDRDDDIKHWAEHLQFLEKNHDAIFVTIDNHFSGDATQDAYTLNKWLNKLNVKTKGFDR